MTRTATVICLLVLSALAVGPAYAKTSHAGWPVIDGRLIMHKLDESGAMSGTQGNDELLGGNGSDTIWGGDGRDVIWGDYKPSGQSTAQVDRLHGGPGAEFIYASHGLNIITAGAGDDTVHAHFGHGTIDCGPGNDIVYLSRRGRARWRLRNCERISYETLGY